VLDATPVYRIEEQIPNRVSHMSALKIVTEKNQNFSGADEQSNSLRTLGAVDYKGGGSKIFDTLLHGTRVADDLLPGKEFPEQGR